MLCPECDGTIDIIVGKLSFKSRMLGDIEVPRVTYKLCAGCQEITIAADESRGIDRYLSMRETSALGSLPVREFITLNEAASILEISKQAFSKNPRIKRGFIYFVSRGNSRLYLKKSVEEFVKNGKDGRIRLKEKVRPVTVEKIPQRVWQKQTEGPAERKAYAVWFAEEAGKARYGKIEKTYIEA